MESRSRKTRNRTSLYVFKGIIAYLLPIQTHFEVYSLEFNRAVRAALVPVAALAVISLLFDIFSFVVRYFGYSYLGVVTLLMAPIALVGFGAVGYLATKKHGLDKTASAFAGGVAGLIYGIVAIILEVIFEVVLSVANPSSQDFYATLIKGMVPVGTEGIISKVVCIGIVMPLSILGGILASYAGSHIATMKRGK